MTDQEISVKKRQAAFTVCKKCIHKYSREVEEIWGGFQEFVEFVLWDGERILGRLDTEKYNEHQFVNYLCIAYKTVIRNNINEFNKDTKSENTISLNSLCVYEDGEERDIDELGREVDYKSIDESNDCEGIIDQVRDIIELEAKENYRKVNYVDYFNKLMEANWSVTEASNRFGGSKSLWNQRAKSVITSVADTIRERYPDYIESYAQLVGSENGGKTRVALTKQTIEGVKIHNRSPKFGEAKLPFIIKVKILRYLRDLKKSAHAKKVADNISHSEQCVKPKLVEMLGEGLVKKRSALTENKRRANQYKITEKGLDFLKENENVRY